LYVQPLTKAQRVVLALMPLMHPSVTAVTLNRQAFENDKAIFTGPSNVDSTMPETTTVTVTGSDSNDREEPIGS
jgi:hypothetical protein